ncbi:polymer-forming cytoskeletal protein [Paraburkholderia sp. RP-4-7]|jgi:cytoskeletal protein CcmA (bactofilin family)|uniref:Polymer-forming cytoskeletal protein n=1 Tax=Paraburkholderia polaris TaxID=2728848 RepID=A0A848IKV4_9BURK|nr:polymer-forming cytoskeletal protein [Paraburkholderia polaris]NMM01486.1 polymer-forming cytoskeletal protein [Paraburkholderia polaris]
MEAQLNSPNETSAEPTYRQLSVSIIAPGCSIEGNVIAEKGLTILGLVTGDVYSQSDLLHIGDTGLVRGNIDGENVLLSGKVVGNVRARGNLSINGHVRGDISYGTIRLGEDADLDGCRIQRIRPEDGQTVEKSAQDTASGEREGPLPTVLAAPPARDLASVTQLSRMPPQEAAFPANATGHPNYSDSNAVRPLTRIPSVG